MLVAIKLTAPRATIAFTTAKVVFGGKTSTAFRSEARRRLNQSAQNNQNVVTNPSNQLISVARNISFRQCRNHQTYKLSPAAYSIAIDSSYVVDDNITYQPTYDYSQGESVKQTEEQSVKREERIQEPIKKYYGQFFNQATTVSNTQRPLVVLMSWLEAKEKHIEKYRQYWLERGYDVLNVKTSPLDLLLPSVGAKKISADFVKFLLEKQYNEIVLHGFSVGGYQFGEFLVELDKQSPEIRDQVKNSIKGIVFDSLVPYEGTCIGVANSITSNKILAKCIERLLNVYLFVCRGIATRHYLKASEKVWGGPLRCPALFIVSEDDPISDINIVKRLEKTWKDFGVQTEMKVFDSSPHVQHFTVHHDQYVEKVDKFLEMLNVMRDNKIGTPPDGA